MDMDNGKKRRGSRSSRKRTRRTKESLPHLTVPDKPSQELLDAVMECTAKRQIELANQQLKIVQLRRQLKEVQSDLSTALDELPEYEEQAKETAEQILTRLHQSGNYTTDLSSKGSPD